MKRPLFYISILFLLFINACEIEHEVMCYPQRVKTVSGADATITADYKYEGNLLDHIVWSNSQTHYFSYSTEDQLVKIEEFNYKQLIKKELRMDYEGDQLMRVDKFISRLDYQTRTEEDTSYLAYHTFDHSGGEVSEEEVYIRNDESEDFTLRFKKEYDYDLSGNISSMVSMDVVSGDTAEAYTFSYDYHKNPFNALKLYFNGESFINNVLQREDLVNDKVYTYQVIYNASQYPQQINIKEGILIQVITFDYTCE